MEPRRADEAGRVRVPIADLTEGDRTLGQRTANYLVGVHRLRSGSAFLAFDPKRGVEADCAVTTTSSSGLAVRIGPVRPAALVAHRSLTWLQAMPKGEKMDAIVRDATELGATCIVPLTSTFTVVKLEGHRLEARRQRWERIAEEAARQCGRSDAPVIRPVMPWPEALREAAATSFCLYEMATTPLAPGLTVALEGPGSIAFLAGSEGGFAPNEVEEAAARGFAPVSLGPFVLRAETVAAATLGAVRILEGLPVRDDPAPSVALRSASSE